MAAGNNQVINISGGSGGVGTPGAVGPIGPDGKSAYDLAVAGGYVGTINQWVSSLTGLTGGSGLQGQQGVQGIAGVGLNVLPPVGTFGDITTTYLNPKPGDALLVTDTGEFWVWDPTKGIPLGTGAWVDAGHLQGPQGTTGAQGNKGDIGIQGLVGPAGTGVKIVGSDILNTIYNTTGSAGDMWIVNEPSNSLHGHGLVSNGLGNGAVNWTDIGQIQGPDGKDGLDGKDGDSVSFKGSDTQANIIAGFTSGTPAIGDVWIANGVGDALLGHGLMYTGGTPAYIDLGLIAGPKGDQGLQGVQGMTGVGINILSPVADDAALAASSVGWDATDTGKSVIVISTGEFWSWNGTSWTDAGHLVGHQGIQGKRGPDGPTGALGPVGPIGPDGKTAYEVAVAGGVQSSETQWLLDLVGATGATGTNGLDGKNGTGVTIKGSDTLTNIQAKSGSAGDMWLDKATGNGWVSDGTTGPTSWTNVGAIQGPVGAQGVAGTQGIDGVGINVLLPVVDDAARNALSVGWTAADAGKSVLTLSNGDFWTWDGTKWVDAGHIIGPQGIQGIQGIPGLQGAQGTVGPAGTNANIVAVDNLASTSATDVLSAGQGKILNEKIGLNTTKLSGIAPFAEVNVQADWTETNVSDDAYIKNKPTPPDMFGSNITLPGYVEKTSGPVRHIAATDNATEALQKLSYAIGMQTLESLPDTDFDPSQLNDENILSWDDASQKWIAKEECCIPEEPTHKGESLGTKGVLKDTKWSITLTTPSKLYADLTIDSDPDVNHILAGPFDTAGFLLDVPAGTTVTVV